MFHDAVPYIQYNTVMLAEEKKAQNHLKTGHAYEMQAVFDTLSFVSSN